MTSSHPNTEQAHAASNSGGGAVTLSDDDVKLVERAIYEVKRVIVGHGLPDVKGAKSGTFKAELHEAPRDWKASTCYVGQSGTL